MEDSSRNSVAGKFVNHSRFKRKQNSGAVRHNLIRRDASRSSDASHWVTIFVVFSVRCKKFFMRLYKMRMKKTQTRVLAGSQVFSTERILLLFRLRIARIIAVQLRISKKSRNLSSVSR